MGNINILFVGDINGNIDEGMKKIAYELSYRLDESDGFSSSVITTETFVNHTAHADILHYIGGPTYRSLLYCFFYNRKFKNVKTIITFSNPFLGCIAEILIRIIPPNHIIVSSDYWRKWVQKLSLDYSFMCLSGVDINKFMPVSLARKNQLRYKYHLPNDKIIILHVGHLKEDRNLQTLLQAQLDDNMQVVIVGSTTTKSSPKLIKKLLDANCILIHEYLPNIEEIYQASDCYVFPTISRKAAVQIPLSIIEAMAINLPVIITKFGGMSTIIPSYKETFYLNQSNLVLQIHQSISKQKNNRLLIQNYSWQLILQRLQKLYFKLYNH